MWHWNHGEDENNEQGTGKNRKHYGSACVIVALSSTHMSSIIHLNPPTLVICICPDLPL